MNFSLSARPPFNFLSVLNSHEWYGGKPVTPKDVEKYFERWGGLKGLAFWFWDWNYKGRDTQAIE